MKNFFLCPIPEDQKPINLYLKTKENPLINWTLFPEKDYQKRLFWLFFCNFFLVVVLRFSFLQTVSYLWEWLLFNGLISFSSLGFFLLFVFSRWKQVQKELNAASIFYEETSWSDGERWEKPFYILHHDQCIQQQKILPILQRLAKSIFQVTTLAFGCLLFLKLT